MRGCRNSCGSESLSGLASVEFWLIMAADVEVISSVVNPVDATVIVWCNLQAGQTRLSELVVNIAHQAIELWIRHLV